LRAVWETGQDLRRELWLLGSHGQETAELRWIWYVARLFGLRRPSDQMEILSWKTRPPSSQ